MHVQTSDSAAGGPSVGRGQLALLSLAALGVVFGDIGTSPLYAMRECFHGPHSIAATPANILGVLSLIVWALITVISVKYVGFILRADNRSEGGILALATLVSHVKPTKAFAVLGLFGASLLYSDGMITPSISVLSAVEGLKVAAPQLEAYVIPITIAILVVLFVFQKHGTARVGTFFGPITLVWFLVLALLGITHIVEAPEVLGAFSPHHGVSFFMRNGAHGFVILGAVFLVVTGGEALYADIGHFGIRPIRIVWTVLVLPALVLNYMGQGSLLLRHPEAAETIFYALAPAWGLIPLVVLASAAAVIASQALITGAFSLTMQAVQLGFAPRLAIRHTSADAMGQIYLPIVNWALMLACIALVLGFRSSSNLAAAYGISITSTMMITSILFYVVARWKWGWSPLVAGLLCGLFIVIDLAFFSANFLKIAHGGWFPLAVASFVFLLLSTWRQGRQVLSAQMARRVLPLDDLMETVRNSSAVRVKGTAVFMSSSPQGTPPALLHNLKHNKVIHEKVVLLKVQMEEVPHVPPEERVTVEKLEIGFWRVVVRFGFMDDPNVPEALKSVEHPEFKYEPMRTSFFLGREKILPAKTCAMVRWREALFAWMAQNSRDATSFFSLPPNSVVELGAQVEI